MCELLSEIMFSKVHTLSEKRTDLSVSDEGSNQVHNSRTTSIHQFCGLPG